MSRCHDGRHAARAALLLIACTPAAAQEMPLPPPLVQEEPEVSQTLPSADVRARMTVDVFVNDRGPYPFIVDTGATRSVVSADLARRLELPFGPSVRLHDIGGTGGARTALLGKLRVGPLETGNVKAPILSAAHIGSDGIVGLDGLAKGRVVMNFAGETMTVTRAAIRPEARDRDTIVVTARRRFGQLILADANVRGEKVFVIIDSGGQYSIGNLALRDKLGRRGKLPPPTDVTLIGVTGNVLQANMALLPTMQIGGVTLGNVPVAFADAHPFRQFGLANKPAMLLGMDLLRAFEQVTLDFDRKTVRFQLRRDQGGRPTHGQRLATLLPEQPVAVR